MKFNFDEIVNRFDTNSYKWKVKENELPMFVADMDFKTAPMIMDALNKRVDNAVFGYSFIPESFKTSVASWWFRRHDWKFENESVLFCSGVIPAISSIIRAITKVDDEILLLTPVYHVFFNSIIDNNRHPIVSDLIYHDGAYSIDFNDLDKKLANGKTKLLILCNPHNPIGKVWSKEDLVRIGQLCIKYNVLILSDEIHCDLTHRGHKYTPMASVSKEIELATITCVSPSKAFNLAGLQTSAIIIPNTNIRQLLARRIKIDQVAQPNSFAIQVTEAAFDKGEEWLEQLIDYLENNNKILQERIKKELPEISFVQAEATYLAWLDCSKITNDTKKLVEFLHHETGLILSAGEMFQGNGNNFVRWNYACPRIRLEDGINRFITAIKVFKAEHQTLKIKTF